MNTLRVIDGLTYLGRDLKLQAYQFATSESLNAMLDKYRLSSALVCSFACATLDVEYGNTKLFQALAGNKRLSPCPAVLPDDNGKILDALIEKGARFCCFLHAKTRTSFDRRVIGPLFSALEKRRLPVALFAPPMLDSADLAKAYPRLPILLHAPNLRDYVFWPLFKQTPNLHLSLAANYSHYRGLEVLTRGNGADRILFASGYPAAEPGAALANLFYSDLKETVRRKIASENLERLMGSVKTGGKRPAAKLPQTTLPVFSAAQSSKSKRHGIPAFVWERKPVPWAGVVDMHAHYGKWVEFPIQGGAADDLVGELDRLGVEKILVSHQACMTPEVKWGNDQVLSAMRRHPDRICGYAACYAVDPQLGLAEIRRCIEGGMTGIKLHSSNGLAYTDQRYAPVWEYADRFCRPVLLHTSGELASFETLFKNYRRAPILLGHAGTSHAGLYVDFARRYKNIYLELTCSAAHYGLVECFVREVGAERVLYGSDAPWMSMPHGLGRVLFADISEADRKKILVENPRRIFNNIRD